MTKVQSYSGKVVNHTFQIYILLENENLHYEPFRNEFTIARGMSVPKIKEKIRHGEEGVHAFSDITTKANTYKFLFFACF